MAIIIDSDSHFLPRESFDDEESRERFGSRWPRFVFDALGRDFVVFNERSRNFSPHQKSLPNEFSPRKHHPGFSDAAKRQEWLDETGFDMQVLVPSPSPFAYDLEPELGLAVCRSYNNAIGRVLQHYPGRFIGLAVLPMQDPAAAVEELDRAVGELGIHAPLVISNVNQRNLDGPEFWPVYDRIEQIGVPLIVHGNRFERGGVVGMDRVPHMHLDNGLGFLYEGTLAITSLIMGGILDMYPRLRVGVLETGAGYLTYLMDRLQEVYEGEIYGGISPEFPKPVKELVQKEPEQYMDQIWLCFNLTAEWKSIPHVVGRFGADRFMINSDFPHGLGGGGESTVKRVEAIAGLNQGQREQLLGLSACKLFGIDPATRKQIRRPA